MCSRENKCNAKNNIDIHIYIAQILLQLIRLVITVLACTLLRVYDVSEL
jgi:hypothetical protein